MTSAATEGKMPPIAKKLSSQIGRSSQNLISSLSSPLYCSRRLERRFLCRRWLRRLLFPEGLVLSGGRGVNGSGVRLCIAVV